MNSPTHPHTRACKCVRTYDCNSVFFFFFFLANRNQITLVDLQFICAMGPPGGGRNPITSRLLRHFNLVAMAEFDDDTMMRIFGSLMSIWQTQQGFSGAFKEMGQTIVRATMHIYKQAIATLLPTPAKSHYVFNLRDMARVINGVLLVRKESFSEPNKMVRLWTHEVFRVLYDRLTDDADRAWLFDSVKTSVKEFFKTPFETVFASLAAADGPARGQVTQDSFRSLLFGDFMTLGQTQPLYDEVTDLNAFAHVVGQQLEEYNNICKTPMHLVVFRYVLEHLARIARVLKQPGGHALLVGVGGSGRQSLTRLAAYIYGHAVVQPEISKSYGPQEWKDDLKKLLTKAGAEGRSTVFLFTDNQMKLESFLEDIDSLLNTGEVANLFAPDEKATLCEAVRPAAQQMDGECDWTPAQLFSFFNRRCRENLHIILCMSPIGSAFRNRLRMFPSLINCCTIDWFQPWPNDALQRVAQKYLEAMELTDGERQSIVKLCQSFHEGARELSESFRAKLQRYNYVTPTSYLELLKSFTGLLQSRRDDIQRRKNRYEVGLEKLSFASSQVAVMKKELEELQPKLKVAQEENLVLSKRIATESKEAAAIEEVVAADEAVANAKAAAARKDKEECEAMLAEALPALEAAMVALNTLKKSDIDVVKSMKSPPAGVKLVMEAVCILKDMAPEKINDPATGKKILDYWGPSKKLLSDLKFLDSLRTYDKDNIPAASMARLREEYLNNPEFVPERVAKASSAAEGLCQWVKAMEVYDRVAKVVAPKKIALVEAEVQVAALMQELSEKQVRPHVVHSV